MFAIDPSSAQRMIRQSPGSISGSSMGQGSYNLGGMNRGMGIGRMGSSAMSTPSMGSANQNRMGGLSRLASPSIAFNPIMPRSQMPDVSSGGLTGSLNAGQSSAGDTYAKGTAAGQDMSWMNQPGALSGAQGSYNLGGGMMASPTNNLMQRLMAMRNTGGSMNTGGLSFPKGQFNPSGGMMTGGNMGMAYNPYGGQ